MYKEGKPFMNITRLATNHTEEYKNRTFIRSSSKHSCLFQLLNTTM